MKVVAIIQARMGSTRLPGKVLADIAGRPMLWRVVHRTRTAMSVDRVLVATTTEPADDAIIQFCLEHQILCFRGSEKDVLDRYYQAARHHGAEIVVRITSDCPLIDPDIIDRTVRAFFDQQPDYASNSLRRSYPRGLDTEVLSFRTLEAAWRNALPPYQRSHVTPYIYENPGQFKILSVVGDVDHSAYRWTVDTPEDLELARSIYARMERNDFRWTDVIRLIEREPELAEINRTVAQKTLQEG